MCFRDVKSPDGDGSSAGFWLDAFSLCARACEKRSRSQPAARAPAIRCHAAAKPRHREFRPVHPGACPGALRIAERSTHPKRDRTLHIDSAIASPRYARDAGGALTPVPGCPPPTEELLSQGGGARTLHPTDSHLKPLMRRFITLVEALLDSRNPIQKRHIPLAHRARRRRRAAQARLPFGSERDGRDRLEGHLCRAEPAQRDTKLMEIVIAGIRSSQPCRNIAQGADMLGDGAREDRQHCRM
ncbi:hypothetical protein LMG7141_04157 [Ralstonia condita]|uniref:Uncharacterized protein n=1 Tax=Ralstonia condita TaxID=3058600 RepID=A0ABM9JTB8_9RALS|nr:hypothetical protein LMG7141_04157 [Ralstonia sp. LMG 7141]